MVLIITPIWLGVNSSLRVWQGWRVDLYQLLDIIRILLATIAVACLQVRFSARRVAEIVYRTPVSLTACGQVSLFTVNQVGEGAGQDGFAGICARPGAHLGAGHHGRRHRLAAGRDPVAAMAQGFVRTAQ